MEAYEIVLLVVLSLLGLYILLFLIRLFLVLSWKKKIKERFKSIHLIIDELFIHLPNGEESLKEIAKSLEEKNEVNKIISLMNLAKELWANKAKEIENKETSYLISDLFNNYQSIASKYNRDIIGYSYWRNGALFKYLFDSLKFEQYERLH